MTRFGVVFPWLLHIALPALIAMIILGEEYKL
jgi:hypothetical protein